MYYWCQDFHFLLDLGEKETLDWDDKIISELSKMSSLTYEKLADHDRIPLIKLQFHFQFGISLAHLSPSLKYCQAQPKPKLSWTEPYYQS